MKMRLIVFAITLSLLFSGMLVAVGGEANDGKESVGEEIKKNETQATQEIHDWHDLNNTRENLLSDHVLKNDLDENTAGYEELVNTSDGWNPIGDSDTPFLGTFDGNDYNISGLYINRSVENYVGLFGYVDGSQDFFHPEIENLGVNRTKIKGGSSVGNVVGYITDSNISNCYAIGNVSGNTNVGGLVGNIYSSTLIQDSYTIVNITGSNYIGGLVGKSQYYENQIKNSYTRGEVIGKDYVGGLVGLADKRDNIINSWVNGNVSGRNNVGGVVGYSYDGTSISSSFVNGNINGNNQVGGLVGYLSYSDAMVLNSYADINVDGSKNVGGAIGYLDSGEVKNVYVIGNVTGDEVVGGFAGKIQHSVSNCYSTSYVDGNSSVGGFVGTTTSSGYHDYSYWNMKTSNQYDSAVGIGLTTEEMTNYTSRYSNAYDGWDFVDVWQYGGTTDQEGNSGYPTLSWQSDSTEMYDLTINVEGKGNTNPEEGTYLYKEGETVTLEATSAEGWLFTNWTGGIYSENLTTEVVMDSNKEITANFVNKFAELEEMIEHLEENITKLEGNITELRNNIIELENDIDELGENVTELWDNVTELKEKLDSVMDDIEKVQDEIDSLNRTIQELGSDVGELETRIDELKGNISSLEENITELEEKIDNLEKRINDLEEGQDDLAEEIRFVRNIAIFGVIFGLVGIAIGIASIWKYKNSNTRKIESEKLEINEKN